MPLKVEPGVFGQCEYHLATKLYGLDLTAVLQGPPSAHRKKKPHLGSN